MFAQRPVRRRRSRAAQSRCETANACHAEQRRRWPRFLPTQSSTALEARTHVSAVPGPSPDVRCRRNRARPVACRVRRHTDRGDSRQSVRGSSIARRQPFRSNDCSSACAPSGPRSFEFYAFGFGRAATTWRAPSPLESFGHRSHFRSTLRAHADSRQRGQLGKQQLICKQASPRTDASAAPFGTAAGSALDPELSKSFLQRRPPLIRAPDRSRDPRRNRWNGRHERAALTMAEHNRLARTPTIEQDLSSILGAISLAFRSHRCV